jgi:phosphate transport system substrate-binding protein
MTQNSEVRALSVALLLTVGLTGGFMWFFREPLLGFLQQKPAQTSSTQNSGAKFRTFAQVENVPKGLFNYGGSTTWAPIRTQVDAALQVVWPQFELRYTAPVSGSPGSGSGIQMLLAGQLTFAQVSRPLSQTEIQQAKAKGVPLKEIPVAIDGIAVAVHPDLNLYGITVDQLKQIYTGKITNWQQVGGSNFPITALSRRPESGGTVSFFQENVLGGEPFHPRVEYIATTTEAVRKVANTVGAIYFASAPEVVPQCRIKPLPIGRQRNQWVAPYQAPYINPADCPAQRNSLNFPALQTGDYPLTRRLLVIVKENGQTEQTAGHAYAQLMLSEQGQTLIKKAGYVPIH